MRLVQLYLPEISVHINVNKSIHVQLVFYFVSFSKSIKLLADTGIFLFYPGTSADYIPESYWNLSYSSVILEYSIMMMESTADSWTLQILAPKSLLFNMIYDFSNNRPILCKLEVFWIVQNYCRFILVFFCLPQSRFDPQNIPILPQLAYLLP